MSDHELNLVQRIYQLERMLKRAHQRTYEQRKRAVLWRTRALRKRSR